MTYGKKKHAARCVADHARIIPASQLIDQAGRVLCDVPAKVIKYTAGEVATFSTAGALAAFLKANNGTWERAR